MTSNVHNLSYPSTSVTESLRLPFHSTLNSLMTLSFEQHPPPLRPSNRETSAENGSIRDIYFEDNRTSSDSDSSPTFAKDVRIPGWTSVGDSKTGGYIGTHTSNSLLSVCSCLIRTRNLDRP